MSSDPIRIQTLFLRHFISPRNTDYRYYRKLKRLEDIYPLEFALCDSLPATIIGNIAYAMDVFFYRSRVLKEFMLTQFWRTLRRSTILPSRYLGKAHADVVFTNQFFPRNKINIPIIFEFDFFAYGLGEEREMIRRILYVPESFIKEARIICVRHELSLEAFKSQFPRYTNKAVLVPFYLPTLETISEAQTRRKFDNFNPTKILFVGNLARLKGLPQLIQAFEQIKNNSPENVELTVVSWFQDGPVEVPPHVRKLSDLQQEEVYRLMTESHIFAMPSRRDATGTVFWEAMAKGCALLVPEVSPQKELFGDFGNTAHPLSVDSIAHALEQMINDTEFCLSRALHARRTFVRKYHHSIVGNKYFDVFQQATS